MRLVSLGSIPPTNAPQSGARGYSRRLSDLGKGNEGLAGRVSIVKKRKTMAKTLAQLDAQIAKLQRQAEALRAREVAGVITRIKVAIDYYGLTAADLGFGNARGSSTRERAGRPAADASRPSGDAVRTRSTASRPAKGGAAARKTAGRKAAGVIRF
ncbi:MAG TPA: H-NS histone family protein, partial [Burkholderiaceae bacterium]|nr:H-NS histone family protein [Burkholderiaceae bacterium]